MGAEGGAGARRLALSAAALLAVAGTASSAPPDERPALAVLPFRVHSAKPIDYLGASLANLIRERLAESGAVRLVDAAALAEALGQTELDPTRDRDLRELGASLGADFAVAGSLTELGGRYSLNVRVTPAASDLRGATQVFTAARDEELVELVGEIADRVLAQVAGAAPAPVARVEILGAPEIEAELRALLATGAGEPYDAARVREDLERLRRHPVVASAEVETERTPAGVVVRFALVPARMVFPVPTPEALEGTVAEVRIAGNRRIESDAIRVRIGTEPGAPLRRAQIAKDVREIHGLGFFRNVSVRSEPSPAGLIVTFEVEENPVVREISISGNDSIDGDKIRDILTLTTGSTLDYPLLFENRGRIEALYRAQGYYLADVGYEVESLTEASVGIHFKVDENEKLKLRSIEFTGNEFFSDGELTEDFQTRTWKFWSYATSWFDRSGTYSEPLFVQDLRQIEKKYTDAGFLRVELGEPDVVASPEGLAVSVTIAEGRRFRVGEIDIAGDETVDIDALRPKLALAGDEYFNRSHLTGDVEVLEEHYTDRGFYFANVTPLTNLSEESDVVDVIFQVRKGPLYFIRQIDISGNTTTVDPVVRREIPIVEGQLYSRRALLLSQDRVRNLGFFEEVDFRPEPTEEPDQLDLHVSVVERPTGSFSFGAGFSSQDRFVVSGSLSQTNLFGRGYGANVSADVGGRTQRFFVSLIDPAFLGSTFSVGATIFRTRIRFEDFSQDQLGADLALGHALTEDNRTRGTLRYSFSSRDIDDERNFQAAAVILREVIAGTLPTSALGVSVTRDTRDDRFAPTAGHRLNAGLEFAGVGAESRFLRLEASGAWWLGAPRWLFQSSSFVAITRLGWAFPFNDIGDFGLPAGLDTRSDDGNLLPMGEIDKELTLPLSERYFLGGLGQFQLRGFRARSVGPRRAIVRRATEAEPADPSPSDAPKRLFVPSGRTFLSQTGTTQCNRAPLDDSQCNNLSDRDLDDFGNLAFTDVVGGNKFITSSFEYRFPISETVGLQGVAFIDFGNAFDETQDNLFDVTDWRYGTGAGVQWFSPFGPLAVVLGFPIDQIAVIEDSPVFEFSVGGGAF